MGAKVRHFVLKEVEEDFLVNESSDHVGIVVNREHRFYDTRENPKGILFVFVIFRDVYEGLAWSLGFCHKNTLRDSAYKVIVFSTLLHHFKQPSYKEIHALTVSNCWVSLHKCIENVS